MLNLFRRMLLAAIDPQYNANQTELKRLRGATPMRRGWARTVQAGATIGFSHLCECGMDVKIAAPLDMFKRFKCNCGESFSLFKDAGIPRGAAPEKFGEYLMRLPARVGAAPHRNQTPQVGTWNLDGDDAVQWVGAPQ